MTFPLRIDHLLWRMANVHHRSKMVDVAVYDQAQRAATFPEVAARARALAHGLRATYNLNHGSVVAVMAFNTRQHVELLLGVPTVGAVVESLNIRTGAEVIERQLHHSSPDVVVVDAQARDHAVVGPTVEAVLEVCTLAGIDLLVIDSRTGEGLDDLLAIGERVLADQSVGLDLGDLGEDDAAYLFHTSGTTGPPKTYTVTHRDAVLHALSQSTTVAANLRTDDRVLPLAPFFHVNGWGLPLTCAITGSDLVLMGADSNAHQILDVLACHQVTVAAAVPTVWFDVCQAARTKTSGSPTSLVLREVLTGGSAVPESVARAVAETLGATVTTAWGMTETMACSTYERDDPVTSAGIPVPLIEARITQPIDGAATYGRGRLEIRGAFIVGSRTSDTAPDGWMDTGDIASVDDAGRIHLHDRQKDLIKSGGEWIVSAELEQALCSHPAVSTAAVVARPDTRWMERPVAYVVLSEADTATTTTGDLREYLASRFPKWWLPDEITIARQLPRTAVGKIDKVALRRAQQPTSTAGLPSPGRTSAVASPHPNNSEVVA